MNNLQYVSHYYENGRTMVNTSVTILGKAYPLKPIDLCNEITVSDVVLNLMGIIDHYVLKYLSDNGEVVFDMVGDISSKFLSDNIIDYGLSVDPNTALALLYDILKNTINTADYRYDNSKEILPFHKYDYSHEDSFCWYELPEGYCSLEEHLSEYIIDQYMHFFVDESDYAVWGCMDGGWLEIEHRSKCYIEDSVLENILRNGYHVNNIKHQIEVFKQSGFIIGIERFSIGDLSARDYYVLQYNKKGQEQCNITSAS